MREDKYDDAILGARSYDGVIRISIHTNKEA